MHPSIRNVDTYKLFKRVPSYLFSKLSDPPYLSEDTFEFKYIYQNIQLISRRQCSSRPFFGDGLSKSTQRVCTRHTLTYIQTLDEMRDIQTESPHQEVRNVDTTNHHQELTKTKYWRAITNKHGLRNDMEGMCKFVRETLFYALIHDARGPGSDPEIEVVKEDGVACKSFVKTFMTYRNKITNVELVGSSATEQEQYLKYLWKEGLNPKKHEWNIRKALSNEKSAVYSGISESFKSKW